MRTCIFLYVLSRIILSRTLWPVLGQSSHVKGPANHWRLSKALSFRLQGGFSNCKALSHLRSNSRAISQLSIGNFRAVSHYTNLVCNCKCLSSYLRLPCMWWCLCLPRQRSCVLNKSCLSVRSVSCHFFSQVFSSGLEESLARTRCWMHGVWAP